MRRARVLTPGLVMALMLILSMGVGARGDAAPQQEQAPPQEAEAQDAPQQPVFRAGINFVRVDIIVTDDDGNPVTDLTIDDFEIFEDGEPQTIETFEQFLITPAVALDEPVRAIRNAFDEEREAARPDVRLFAIFLDDYHVRHGSSLRVKEPLIEFIRTQLAPTDLVGIMYPLTPLSAVRMTRDREAIIEQIERFEGRKYDYEPRNLFEFRYAQAPTMEIERIRNEVSLSGLRALVTHLGGLRDGRKSLILVSEGYTNILPPQLRQSNAFDLYDPRQRNPFVGSNDPREQAMQMTADLTIQIDLQRVFEAANRANTSIYALDPRGLSSFEFDINEGVGFTTDRNMLNATIDTLRALADTTDGRAIVNQNDLLAGLRQAVKDSSSYYLLGYNSTQTPTDGRFHEIRVRLKRRGLDVRARKGYWALTMDDLTRLETPTPEPAGPSNVDLALSLLDARRNQRLVQTWIGMAKAENGLTRLTFVWRPAPRVPGQRREEPIRISMRASGDGGATFFRDDVPDGPALLGESGVAGPARAVFDVKPGPIELDLSIEGAGGGILDNSVQHFVAPDFAGVALSSPHVLRARNALEFRRLRSDPDAIPETGRVFRRTDRLLVRFRAYGPGASPIDVTARLLNRGGASMADLPLQAPATADAPYVLDLPLASLAPGEYLIELKAAVGDDSVDQLIALRVTS